MKRQVAGAESIAAMCLVAPQALGSDVLQTIDYGPTLTSPTMYASVFVGFTAPTTITGSYYGSSAVELDAGWGFAGGVAVGTNITSNVRGELELSFTHHGIDDDNFMRDWDCGDPSDCDAHGSISTIYLLGNAWWDFDMGGGFTPYVGAGVGAAWVEPDVSLYEGQGYDPYEYSWDEGSLAPAAQLGLGVQVDFSDNMKLDLGYRAKAVLGANFSDSEHSCGEGGTGACDAVDMMFVEHVLQAGLTFEF